MSICPIIYEVCEGKYSPGGLQMLSRSLRELHDLPYTALDQVVEAAARAPQNVDSGCSAQTQRCFEYPQKRF